jgi:hypothetical protein
VHKRFIVFIVGDNISDSGRGRGHFASAKQLLRNNGANDRDWFIERNNMIGCADYSGMIASADLT